MHARTQNCHIMQSNHEDSTVHTKAHSSAAARARSGTNVVRKWWS